MPYLICNQCQSAYELEEGESPEDFDLKCECGGQFQYYASKYEYYKKIKEDKARNPAKEPSIEPDENGDNQSKGFLNNLDGQSRGLLGVGVFCIIAFIAIFATGAFSSGHSIFSSMNPSYADIIPANIMAAKAPILVELYAPRCSACQQFDSQVMANPEVQSKLSGYSVMRINVDTDQENASHFKTSVIPTLVLLDANGKEIRRNVGYMDVNEFLGFLKI